MRWYQRPDVPRFRRSRIKVGRKYKVRWESWWPRGEAEREYADRRDWQPYWDRIGAEKAKPGSAHRTGRVRYEAVGICNRNEPGYVCFDGIDDKPGFTVSFSDITHAKELHDEPEHRRKKSRDTRGLVKRGS